MPLPGLQIYLEISGQKEILQPILTPKVDRFMLLLKRPLVRICVEISHSLSKYVHEFGMDVRINGWKEGQPRTRTCICRPLCTGGGINRQ